MNQLQQIQSLFEITKKPVAEQEKPTVIKEEKPIKTEIAVRKLDAVIELGNGVITTSEFHQLIRPDADTYDTILLTEEEEIKVRKSLSRSRSQIVGSTAMICSGDKCEFGHECPLLQIGKAPLQKPCPIELELLAQWTQQYMFEFDVQMDNFTELGLVTELAECNLFERRANLTLGKHSPTMTVLDVVAVDSSGNAIQAETIAKAWELKERIKSRRDKILKQLMATRDAKVKLKAIQTNQQQVSVLQQMASIKEKMEQMAKLKEK